MKDFILGAVAVLLFTAAISYAVIVAYPNQQCAHVESILQAKQENPDLYPGLTITPILEEACPAIRENLGL